MTIFESIERTQRIINQVNFSPALAAMSAMPSAIQQQIDQVNAISELFTRTSKTAFQQVDQIASLFKSSAVQRQFEQLQSINNTVLESFRGANLQVDSALEFMRNPTIQSQLEQIGKIGSIFEQLNNSKLNQITSALEAYRSPAIKMQLENFQSISQATLFAISQSVMEFDFSDIQFNDNGLLIYEGVEYSQEAIEEELHLQVKVAESNPISLKESVDKLKERYWLIGLIIWLLLFLPQLPQAIDFYDNIITQVYQVINEVNPVCYVIKERAYLREEANAKSKIVTTLVYDTALEILEKIPRWLYVKYIDDEGTEQIGWISKISVETEEKANEQ